MSEYTLLDRYYKVFKDETERLFVEKIKNIFKDVKLKETYEFIQNQVSNNSGNYELVDTFNGLKGIRIKNNNSYEELIVSCTVCIEEDIKELFKSFANDIYTIKIVDRIWYKGLSVHFNKSEQYIVLSYKLVDSLQYILLKDYTIIENTFLQDEYKYILIILCYMFDYLYQFED